MNILTRLKRLGFRARPLITAADTKAPPSAAEEPIKVRIPRLQPSPGQPATTNGPAASDSKCAHWWKRIATVYPSLALGVEMDYCGHLCGAYRYGDLILVPAADQAESTSAKPDSTPSAPAWTFAPSGSPLTRGKAVSG